MFQQLLSRTLPKGEHVLGFRLARELDDCGKDIMAVFGVADFYRDYENEWEWIESSNGEQMHVNISRPHNWKSGDYNVPVIVRVSGPADRLADELVFGYAQQIANRLRTDVWVGRPIFQPKNDRRYEFDIETRFSPVA